MSLVGRLPLPVSRPTAVLLGAAIVWLKRRLLVKYAKRVVRKVQKRYRVANGPARLRRLLKTLPDRKLVVGAAEKADKGWIPTDQEYLDLVLPATWSRFFPPDSIDAILAEHVWEHLTAAEAQLAARNCFRFLKPGGYLRVAVPDGFHPSPQYQSWVKVGGALPSQVGNDHQVLYTHQSLRHLFESAGFEITLYEFYDEAGTFHCQDFDVVKGKIWRSRRFDPRNANGSNGFTSVILDAVKP